jgi:hypothetical protein
MELSDAILQFIIGMCIGITLIITIKIIVIVLIKKFKKK